MKSRFPLVAVLSAIFLGLQQAAFAVGTAPTEISEGADNMTAGFTVIKALVLTVITFGIVIGYLKLLKKK